MSNLITIRQLKNNIASTDFLEDYINILINSNDSISNESKVRLLKIAIVFLNYGDVHLQKLGYRIILAYSNLFNDYIPLYDVSLNLGYIPVSKYIEHKILNGSYNENNFFKSLISSFQDIFKQQDIFLSFGQKKLIHFSNESDSNYVLVAPTSYGKSEIIINEVYRNLNHKTCIIVPSKALLAQTKKRLIEHNDFSNQLQRIITHPDMYKGDENGFVAVLTQERLLRLLQKNPALSLDLVLVDEAHNIFQKDNRAVLLSQVLLILKKRNDNVLFKFFTPFISDANNLKIPHTDYDIEIGEVSEFIKIERFYVCDFSYDRKIYLYDQFLDDFYLTSDTTYSDDIHFVLQKKAHKNIVYVNRPKDIEKLAMELMSSNQLEQLDELEEAYNAISEYVHSEYNLLKCIKSGLVYHHGSMPEVVRLYVEGLFTNISQLQLIVTNSTLLEGVNIPAERIFLLSTKIGRGNFSKSQFKNLIGRVCRFREVFNSPNQNLKLLEPEIYILNGSYEWNNANPRNFLKQKAKIDISIKDDVENILMQKEPDQLSPDKKEELKSALEYLENIEPNTVNENNLQYAQTEIGKLCYSNNVYDFNIIENESVLNTNLDLYNQNIDGQINDISGIMDAFNSIFIENINITEESIQRLSNESARRFYSMFLNWRINGSSYNEMIAQFLNYWRRLSDPIIYVGSKWGEIKLNEQNHRTFYVDLRTKNESQRINLAIVRIKEEQDFVDNSFLKYVEILHDLDLINSNFYDQLKYGTSDRRIISLLKNGFSLELAKKLVSQEYISFININIQTDEIIINPEILVSMNENDENKIIIFELSYHMK